MKVQGLTLAAITALLVTALLVTALVVLLRTPGAPEPAAEPAPPVSTTDPVLSETPDPAANADPRGATRAGVLRSDRDDATGAPKVAVDPSDATSVVRVVDPGTGAPVSDATVWVLNLDEATALGAPDFATTPIRATLANRPDAGHTDQDGRVEVSRLGPATTLVAMTPERFGLVRCGGPGPSHEWTVFATRDAPLRVMIVDEHGIPRPFVPVELVVRSGSQAESWAEVIFRGAALPGNTWVDVPEVAWRIERSEVANVHAELRSGAIFSDAPGVPVDARNVARPGEIVQVITGPCAPVRVRVYQSDGSPWPAGGRVSIVGSGPSPRDDGIRDGQAVVDCVHVAPAFQVRVDVFDPRFPAQFHDVPANRPAWVESTVDVRLPAEGEKRAVLHGRLVDVDGSPLANQEFEIVPPRRSGEFDDEPRREPRVFRTEASGAFYVNYFDESEPRRRAIVRRTPRDGASFAFDPTRRALFELPTRALGVHDLGTLRMESVPLLVAGRVRNVLGAGARGAVVRAAFDDGAAAEQATNDMLVPWPPRRPREIVTRSDADGAFAIHAWTEGAGGLLWVDPRREVEGATDPPASAIEFRAGQRDVVLEAYDPRRITGNVCADAATQVALRVHLKDASDERSTILVAGRFRFDEFSPGPGRLWIATNTDGSTLWSIDDLELPVAGPCDDPRLRDIDLSGRLHPLVVHVLQPDGTPAAHAEVGVAPGGTGERRRPSVQDLQVSNPLRALSKLQFESPYVTQTGPDGRVSVPIGEDAVDFVVLAEGCRGAFRSSVASDVTLELEPAYEVQVSFSEDASLAEVSFAGLAPRDVPMLELQLVRGMQWSGYDPLAIEDRRARLLAAWPGRYELLLIARTDRSPVSVSAIARIDVPGDRSIQVTQAQIDAARPPK